MVLAFLSGYWRHSTSVMTSFKHYICFLLKFVSIWFYFEHSYLGWTLAIFEPSPDLHFIPIVWLLLPRSESSVDLYCRLLSFKANSRPFKPDTRIYLKVKLQLSKFKTLRVLCKFEPFWPASIEGKNVSNCWIINNFCVNILLNLGLYVG